jgi:ABC-type iron transport system FetAB ATPase subunit
MADLKDGHPDLAEIRQFAESALGRGASSRVDDQSSTERARRALRQRIDAATILCLIDRIELAEREKNAHSKEAARYRWLRDGGSLDIWASTHPCDEPHNALIIDARIDRSIEASNRHHLKP